MENLLTTERINKAYQNYLLDHEDELNLLINKKIEIATKAAITQAFSTGEAYNSRQGWARKLVSSLVDKKVKSATTDKTVNVDVTEIQSKINTALQRKLKKLDVDIKM